MVVSKLLAANVRYSETTAVPPAFENPWRSDKMGTSTFIFDGLRVRMISHFFGHY